VARVCVLFAGLFVGASLVPAGAQNPPTELKIGFPEPMFKDVPQVLITSAAKPFQNMIQDKSGLKGSIDIATDYKELAQRITTGKVDIAVFHGFEYAWVKQFPEIMPLVATVPSCGKVQACLIVHVNSKAKEAKDLKGACVLIPKSGKAHCEMFLNHLRETIPVGDCSPAKPGGLCAEEVLGEVAAGNADAALVDVSALLALKNSFPGSFKQLRVLAQSEELPSAVVVYRKGALNATQVTAVRAGLIDCVKTPSGRIFTVFWGLKGFEEVGNAYNEHVERSLKAYPAPK